MSASSWDFHTEMLTWLEVKTKPRFFYNEMMVHFWSMISKLAAAVPFANYMKVTHIQLHHTLRKGQFTYTW